MTHCYILDLCETRILHVEIPDNVIEIETYIEEKYNVDTSTAYIMCSDYQLNIQEL